MREEGEGSDGGKGKNKEGKKKRKAGELSLDNDNDNDKNSAKLPRGHRQQSEVWTIIGDGSDSSIHLRPVITCRFCRTEVRTSAKPNRAIHHLQKCPPGKSFLERCVSSRTVLIISLYLKVD